MARWRAHGAVFVEGGKRRKGVVYLSDSAPKARAKAKPKKGTVASRNRRRRKHGRR